MFQICDHFREELNNFVMKLNTFEKCFRNENISYVKNITKN